MFNMDVGSFRAWPYVDTLSLVFFSLPLIAIAYTLLRVSPRLKSTPNIPITKQAVYNEQQQHFFKIAILSLVFSLESESLLNFKSGEFEFIPPNCLSKLSVNHNITICDDMFTSS